jgi:ribosome-associated protein
MERTKHDHGQDGHASRSEGCARARIHSARQDAEQSDKERYLGIDDGRKLRQFSLEAARLMADRHCEDVQLLDVRGISQVCDYLLIGSGTSDRQMRSVADELSDLGAEQKLRAFHIDADSAATWVVVDFIGLVVHLFEPGMRAYYDLESLWSDAEPLQWQREAAPRSEQDLLR